MAERKRKRTLDREFRAAQIYFQREIFGIDEVQTLINSLAPGRYITCYNVGRDTVWGAGVHFVLNAGDYTNQLPDDLRVYCSDSKGHQDHIDENGYEEYIDCHCQTYVAYEMLRELLNLSYLVKHRPHDTIGDKIRKVNSNLKLFSIFFESFWNRFHYQLTGIFSAEKPSELKEEYLEHVRTYRNKVFVGGIALQDVT